MHNITIHNLRNEKPTHIYDIRVDRTSPLGNPFYMQFEEQRNEVCDKYEVYFNEKVKNEDYKFMNELCNLLMFYEEYGKLRLFCWCSPKRCHAETIRNYLINIINNMI